MRKTDTEKKRMPHYVLGSDSKSDRSCEGLAARWSWYQWQQAAFSCLRASGQQLLYLQEPEGEWVAFRSQGRDALPRQKSSCWILPKP